MLRSTLLRTSLVLFLVVGLLEPVSAQGPRRGPRGKLKILVFLEPEHVEARTIRVFLSSPGGDYRQSATLNDELSCLFGSVWQGDYILTVESEGFITAERTIRLNPTTRHSEIVATVKLRLKGIERLLEKQEQTVTVGQLSIPKEAQEELAKASKASQENRHEEAIAHLKRSVEIHPRLYQAYNNLAVEYLKIGQPENAKSALLKSTELEPKDPIPHRNLGEIYLSQRMFDKAIESLEIAIDLQPNSAHSLRVLGEVHVELMDCESALPLFLSALKIDPKEHAYLGIASCYLESGRDREALDELHEFLRLHPTDRRADAIKQTIKELSSNQRDSTQ